MSKHVMVAKCKLCGQTVTLFQDFSTEQQIEWYMSNIYRPALNKGLYKPALHKCEDGNIGILEPVGFVKQD